MVQPAQTFIPATCPDIYQQEGVIQKPQPILTPDPEYPVTAQRERIEGSVILEAVITREGAVASARVLRSVHPLVDTASIQAIRGWRYKPATRTGTPVCTYLTVTTKFYLSPPSTVARMAFSLEGMWQLSEKRRHWIYIGPNGEAYQCKIVTDDNVLKTPGTLEKDQLSWERHWPKQPVHREADGLRLGDGPDSLFFVPIDYSMAWSCKR